MSFYLDEYICSQKQSMSIHVFILFVKKPSDLALDEDSPLTTTVKRCLLHYVRRRPSSIQARQSKTLAAPLASGREWSI